MSTTGIKIGYRKLKNDSLCAHDGVGVHTFILGQKVQREY
jgi:hypothetical protein